MTEMEVQGFQVFIRAPTVKEYRQIQSKFDDDAEGEVHFVATCLVDQDGNQVFTPDQVDEWPMPEYMRVLPEVRKAAFRTQDDEGKKD